MEQWAERMIAPIRHRGPDDQGVWSDARAGIALGFRRLAIIDLSEHGHQPMRSASGRYVLVFNGEVYNHGELRRELEAAGWRFRGHSDTEVILAAFERWGIEVAVRRFVGMFAMAVWDTERRSLSLLRDRLGIKPLFVYAREGRVTFGSELKALLEGPEFDRSLDMDAVSAYLRYLYVPAPATIFRHARKLLPGHILTIRDAAEPLPEPVPYWAVEEVASRGAAGPFRGSDADAVEELERLLDEAVRLRLQADVPLGALLSGGIDSTTVVALAQAASARPLQTFTIGFEEGEYDEAPHAARVAQHLGTEHTELRLSGADALALVPRLPELFDEPLADPSQIPTYLVCRLARERVTVALSGDGGDEVFAGYNRYLHGERVISRAGRVPRPVRRLMAAGIRSISPASWDRAYNAVTPVLPAALQQRLPVEKLVKIEGLMGWDSPAEMYRSLLSAWQRPESVVVGGGAGESRVEAMLGKADGLSLLDRMMLADQATYLADDLLAKVDRASMAVSLEARVPLLDHRVVEFGWRLPRAMKVREGQSKWLLRQVAYRHVPRELLERPKMGFSVPIAGWLTGPLRGWAEDLLFSNEAGSADLLHPLPVRRSWNALQAGQASEALGLWAVLMLLAWRERWL